MIYGVKVIHAHTVGEDDKRCYEELVLRVKADSFDDAYCKAENYMNDSVCEYINPKGETVKTLFIEIVDCFQAFEPDGDVQEIYSAFTTNNSSLSEDEYYNTISYICDVDELCSLQNIDYN